MAVTTVLIRGGDDSRGDEVTLKPAGNPLMLLCIVLMLLGSLCRYKRR